MRLGEHQSFTDATQRALDSTGDIGVFRNTGAHPLRINRWGFLCSVAWDVDAFVAKLDHTTHALDGTPTRSDGSGGFNATLSVDQVVGSLVFVTVGGDNVTGTANLDATGELILKPGDFLTFQVTSAMTAGDGHPFVDYQNMNFDDVGRNSEFSEEDGTAASKLRVVNGAVAI